MAAPDQEQRISNEYAAAQLVAASAVEFEKASGERVELWTIDHEGPVVVASGPRLSVARDMRLISRVAVGDGALHVHAVIETAEYRSASRATLTLRVTEASLEKHERRAARLNLQTPVTLRALTCGRIVPGETVAATLHDLSETGAGVIIADSRIRRGDRLQLSTRFVEGQLDCEVSVVHTARSPKPGVVIAGCAILHPNPTRDTLLRVLARLDGQPTV